MKKEEMMNTPPVNPNDPNNSNNNNANNINTSNNANDSNNQTNQINLNKPNNSSHSSPSDNPFAAPSEQSMRYEQAISSVGEVLPEPRSWHAGRGLSWLTTAVSIFINNWLLWLGMSFAFLVLIFVVSFIPLIGNLILSFTVFHFTAGMMVGCHEQVESGELKFEHLFAAFQTHMNPLLMLSLWYLIGTILVFIPVLVFGVIGFFMGMGNIDEIESMSQFLASGSFLTVMIGVLLSLALYIPLIMSIWMAPALIVLHDIEPIDAMKMSFQGCLKNMLPFLIVGLVTLFIIPLSVIFTLGLGLLVIIPVMMISYYTSYRDIWNTDLLVEA